MKIDRDSVVAVTGASRGIGRAAAAEFAKRGAKLVLLARDAARLEHVAQEIRAAGGDALVVACDVSREEDCRNWVPKALARFGKIDVLVNNAGYGHYSPVESLPTSDLDRIFRTNLYGALWNTQAVLPQMKERHKGHIVNVSTIISIRSVPYMTAYCMTKFAMNALDEGLRIEVRPFGIDVSLVCPGLTATDFQTNAVQASFKPFMKSASGMSPQKVGRAIVRAVERERKRTYLTLAGKTLFCFQKVSPRFVDQIMYRMYGRKYPAPPP
ncbi:MAG: SDR family oxidoreductase [Pseudomonadota bacterium]